jgi:phosphate transport system permease protein
MIKQNTANTAKTGYATELISETDYAAQMGKRNTRGKVAEFFFLFSNLVGLLIILVLVGHIVNNAFGMVVITDRVDPSTLAEQPLEELNNDQLVAIIETNIANRTRVIIRDRLSQVDPSVFTTEPVVDALAGATLPEGLTTETINDLSNEQIAFILANNLDSNQLVDIIKEQIVQPTIVASWQLIPSIFNRAAIEEEAATSFETGRLEFRSWVNLDFISSSASSRVTTAGLRTALLGTAWIMLITVVTSLTLGVGAAIYLEEYSQGGRIAQFLEINIRNLAAIPSVIYGMLGLAIFVRVLNEITSGQIFGLDTANGRTVLSAGLTLALLILPNLIVTSQEALRAVPRAVREASFGLGATRWQTVSRQVLPAAIPGILTGVILSVSRAIGETAPLLVVGASTFIAVDPSGPFSKFTVVPIQIFQWTAEPDQTWRNAAAAAIIVLLTVMILLNLTAIVLRNRLSQQG